MNKIIESFPPELIWFLVGLFLLLLELAAPGLIIVFFGVGAWIVSAVCYFAQPTLNAQLLIFILSSLILLFSLRKWLTDTFRGFNVGTTKASEIVDDFVGEKAVVIKEIIPGSSGKVEFHGTSWTAEADEPIAVGQRVEILAKNSLTLKVKPL